jgi:hypothetical protein
MTDTATNPPSLDATPIPIHAQAQSVTPWDVAGEVDSEGKVVAINYNKLVY